MKDRVIYSVVFGNYDPILNIEKNPDWDYVYFTDYPKSRRPESYNWEYREVGSDEFRSPMLANRWYKTHPHSVLPEFKYSLYIDSNVTVRGYANINKMVNRLILNEIKISMPKHYLRDCIYDEAKAVVCQNRCNPELVASHIEYLNQMGYPRNFGLCENNIIFREHNDVGIVDLMDDWWEYINCSIHRDQLSLMYLLWAKNVQYSYLFDDGTSARDNEDIFFEVAHKTDMATRLGRKIRRILGKMDPWET